MIRNEKGFTLIELMVVVLIIGILVAVAIPTFSNAASNAKTKACQANLRTLDGAMAQYEAEYGSKPVDVSPLTDTHSLITAGFLEAAPKDPHDSPPAQTYSIASGKSVSADGTTY